MGRELQTLDIIVPCYNESQCIDETAHRLQRTFQGKPYGVRVIFVNDGSNDDTLAKLSGICADNPHFTFVSLSRNFGHQNAVSVGISYSKADATVIIDADLQDPPDLILSMVEIWVNGADVVYGVRRSRSGESRFKRWTASAFYRVLNSISEVPIPLDTGDFRLMDSKVIKTLNAMPEANRFIRGMVSWVGFSQVAISYDRDPRFAGTTKYPLNKMLKFAADGLLSFSTRPLRLATISGIAVSATSFFSICLLVALKVANVVQVPGWTLLIITVLFMGGCQLLGLGILGEYIGRIYRQSQGRPLAVVEPISGDIHSFL